MAKNDNETKVLVAFRLERSLYREVEEIAEATAWSQSDVFRYLIKTGIVMLHPDVEIPAWKIAEFIAPLAIKEIQKGEALRRKMQSKRD